MKLRVEEEYTDILYGVEVAIVRVVSEVPDLGDRMVLAEIDVLMTLYSAEIR